MKKNKLIIYSSLSILVIVLIMILPNLFKKYNTGETLEELEYKNVYETNQFQIYKQFSNLVSNCKPEELVYQGDVIIENKLYYQYKLEDVTLHVINISNEDEIQKVDYNISYGDNIFQFVEDIAQYPEGIQIYYVDINKDNKKDIVVIGAPYSGTNNTYYWIHAVDLTTMDEIPVFASKDRYITKHQEEQILSKLGKDEEFHRIFPDMEGMNYSTIPRVDMFGNLYYELGIGKGLMHDLGNILILFDYNKETKNYDVSDYVYMPSYVH